MTKPLSPDDVAAIHAGMDMDAVLVFHDQRIDATSSSTPPSGSSSTPTPGASATW